MGSAAVEQMTTPWQTRAGRVVHHDLKGSQPVLKTGERGMNDAESLTVLADGP